MIIDKSTYRLGLDNFINSETIKKQIVIGHTATKGMTHFVKWITRLNGEYKKTAHYTIDREGNIFEHFRPICTSNILENTDLNKKSIVILLENEGWLVKDEEKNQFIDWIGNIYNKPEEILEKKWRGYSFWVPYTKKQFESTLKLVDRLCNDFFIQKFAIEHNTKIEDLDNFEGVLYRSNIQKNYTDLNPSWDCQMFKYKLENQ